MPTEGWSHVWGLRSARTKTQWECTCFPLTTASCYGCRLCHTRISRLGSALPELAMTRHESQITKRLQATQALQRRLLSKRKKETRYKIRQPSFGIRLTTKQARAWWAPGTRRGAAGRIIPLDPRNTKTYNIKGKSPFNSHLDDLSTNNGT